MRKIKRRKNKQIRNIILSSFALLFIITIGYSAFQTNITLTAKGNAKDKSRIIKSWTNTSDEDFHTDYYRENIVSITFLDTAIVPEGLTSWDVSETGDRGVMAYVKPSVEEGKFDLFIGAKRGVVGNENSMYMLYGFKNVVEINFKNNFDTSQTANMSGMFEGCNKLKYLDLSSFNTTNVTLMTSMFFHCHELEEIDLSSFNTNNVMSMYRMFSECYKLKKLNLANFDTSNVSTTYSMFGNCNELEKLDLSNFNTSKVRNMIAMFYRCYKLSEIKFSDKFTTSNVTDMTNMFSNCLSLKVLDLSSFDTSKVINMNNMFAACQNLTTIYASNKFVTTIVEDSNYMFSGTSSIVGGNGTTHNSNYVDKEYARIDTAETPGYFTLKTNN